MKAPLLASFLLGALLLAGARPQAHAQKTRGRDKLPVAGYIPWFTVQNKTVVLQTGATTKPLTQDVTLPNGIRVEYRTQSIVLTNGKRVQLKEGDLLNLNGDFVQKAPEPVATPAAPAVTPTVAAAPALTAPAAASSTPAPVASPPAAPAPTAPAPVAATPAASPPVAPAPVASAPAAPTPAAPAPAASAPATSAPAAAPAAPSFTYRPAAPVNGKLRGVVELGASGFDMFIIRVDEKRNWKTEKVEYGNSMVMENMATETDIRAGLKKYIAQMIDFGVAGPDIHFVVSSGAALSPSAQRIVASLKALKYVATVVTPEREGALGLRAALPPDFIGKAFMMDMGSANSRLAWYEDGKPRVVETYGSKYYEQKINPAVVAADAKAKAAQVPIPLRGTCFIMGGAPFDLAKTTRQGQEPYTVLRPADAYAQLTGAKTKAGLNIYQAVAAATGCQQFVFGYAPNFTIGYLLSLP